MQGDDFDRRERSAQRAAVSEVLEDDGVVLRMASGEVLVYDETPVKAEPVTLRAVVMPDGKTEVFPTNRFRRRRS